MSSEVLSTIELHEAWPALSTEERLEGFGLLSRADAEELFDMLDERERFELMAALPRTEARLWMRFLAPDDAADVLQEAEPGDDRASLLALLEEPTRKEVLALLAYAEDAAGGLMNPRFARLRPDMTVDAAISYLRRQREEQVETIYYAYVLDGHQKLLGVVSLRDLVTASSGSLVSDVMESDVVSVEEETDQEYVSYLLAEHDLSVIPVVDDQGRMKGIVTVDDIVDVVQEEATEDMQKIGGTEALDAPYLQAQMVEILQKRAGWLALLIVLGFLSVLAMSAFESTLAKSALLPIFVPLIIASGGNSGSQAATLVVRAMALQEVHLRDWWRVIRREIATGLALGTVLGLIGFITSISYLAIMAPQHSNLWGPLALTVAVAVLGVVLWGTLAGSMLPFALRACRFDPASASAPLVATLVDASGLVIYLGIASLTLREILAA